MPVLNLKNTIKGGQKLFIQTIYHDGRKGYGMRLTFLHGKESPVSYSSINYENLRCDDKTNNVYITLSTHTGKRRVSSQLFNRSTIYVDIDFHDDLLTPKDLEQKKSDVVKKLNDAYDQQLLPIPTCSTDSGRGLAIYYVLEHSIAVSEKTEKMLKLFNKIYEQMIDAYEYVLGAEVRVDRCVKDSSRVVRLPDTVNQHNGLPCRLIYLEKNRYSNLSDLRTGLEKVTKARTLAESLKKSAERKAQIGDYAAPVSIYDPTKERAFLYTRIERLKKLAMCRAEWGGKGNEKGGRELLLFITYNAAIRFYGEAGAKQVIEDINNLFSEPLERAEVNHIITSSVKGRAEDTKTVCGFYRYKDSTIISLLGISEEENRHCRFGSSCTKEQKRYEIKEAHRKEKRERDNKVIELIRNTELTYQEISAEIGVSIATINRIAKKYCVCRYNSKSTVQPVIKHADTLKTTVSSNQQQRINENKSRIVKIDGVWCREKDGWLSPIDLDVSKISFCARKSFAVPFDVDNVYNFWACSDPSFSVSSEASKWLASIADEKCKDFWEKLYHIGWHKYDYIIDFVENCKQKRERVQYDAELTAIVKNSNDLRVIEELIDKWWEAHDPLPRLRDIRRARSERYKQWMDEQDQRAHHKQEYFKALQKRFEDAYLLLGKDSFNYYLQMKTYYFRIYKTAKAGRDFYALRSGKNVTHQQVMKKLLSLTAEDLIAVANKAKFEGKIYHEFAWYLNEFMEVI